MKTGVWDRSPVPTLGECMGATRETDCLTIHNCNGIAWLTFNRPDCLNALDRKLWSALAEALVAAAEDDAVRVIVLAGTGRAFSVGDDIKEVLGLDPEEVGTFMREYALPAVRGIIENPKPVIAAVNGLAYGGGCELAMTCDLIIAADTATFAVPEAKIGAIPPIAAVLGPHLMGKFNTNYMTMTGEPLGAHDAQRIGLVNRVVDAEQLRSEVTEMAEALIRSAPSSLARIKRITNDHLTAGLDGAINELVAQLNTVAAEEGHGAFVEKRKPSWASEESGKE